MIKTLTFDLWQTLFLFTREYGDKLRRLRSKNLQITLGRYGFSASEAETVYNLFRKEMENKWLLGLDLASEERFNLFLKILKGRKAIICEEGLFQELEGDIALPFIQNPPEIEEKAVFVLEKLKKENFKIGLVSNTGETVGKAIKEVLDEKGLINFFDALIFSDEVKYRKPKKEIFLYALKKLNVSPEETLHVGDDLGTDIVGAKSVGMQTCLLRRNKNVEADLLNIKPDFTIEKLAEILEIVEVT